MLSKLLEECQDIPNLALERKKAIIEATKLAGSSRAAFLEIANEANNSTVSSKDWKMEKKKESEKKRFLKQLDVALKISKKDHEKRQKKVEAEMEESFLKVTENEGHDEEGEIEKAIQMSLLDY